MFDYCHHCLGIIVGLGPASVDIYRGGGVGLLCISIVCFVYLRYYVCVCVCVYYMARGGRERGRERERRLQAPRLRMHSLSLSPSPVEPSRAADPYPRRFTILITV